MRLLVYEPTDCQPRNMAVDGPPGDALLRQAVGGEIEDVPGFNSIFYDGDLHRCVAFCNERGKDLRLPQNAWATALWHSALRHQGYERGLRREDGTVADRLVGNVVIVFEDRAFQSVTTLAQSPAIISTSVPVLRETCREIDLIAEAERLFMRPSGALAAALLLSSDTLTPTMDRVFSYKGFNIRTFEEGQDRWFAEIRKTNGAWIIVRGERREVVTTSAHRAMASAAIDLAIDAIDGEEMK
jgi:hypothetical protein